MASLTNFNWVKNYGLSASSNGSNVTGISLAGDSSGNLFVTGTAWNNSNYLSTVHTYVSKADAGGNILWTYCLPFSPNDVFVANVASDQNGNVYFQSVNSVGISYLSKLSSAGTPIWSIEQSNLETNIPSTQVYESVAVDGDGYIYAIGNTVNGLNTIANSGGVDGFLAKYDPTSGALIWQTLIGSAGNDVLRSVTTDAVGNVYIAGTTNGNVAAINSGGMDGFVGKYTSDGSLIWKAQIPAAENDPWNNNSNAVITVDDAGNIYLAGTTSVSMNGAPYPGGYQAGYLCKLDSNGNTQWTQEFGNNAEVHVAAIALTSSGNIIVVGDTYASLNGQPYQGGYADWYSIQYKPDGVLLSTEEVGTSSLDVAQAVAVDSSGRLFIGGYSQGDLYGLNPASGGANAVGYVVSSTPGSLGDDTYQYAFDSQVTIDDPGGNDQLILSNVPESTFFNWNGSTLEIFDPTIADHKLSILNASGAGQVELLTWGNLSLHISKDQSGSANSDLIVGLSGNDLINALEGNDLIIASLGNDTINGGNGNDFLNGNIGSDAINGDAGNDTLNGGAGNDDINGGDGIDWADYSYASGAVTVNLATGTSSGADGIDAISNIEAILGSDYDDNLSGDAGNDSLYGGAGYDYLTGGAGNDTLDGGVIPTIFTGQYTFDNNTASYSSSIAGINVNLQTGTAQDGLGGTDTLSNINIIQGSNFADVITGSTRAVFEEIRGGRGDDTLDGGVISDTINHIDQNRVSYSSANGAVTVDLRAGTATGADGSDTLSNFNQIRGSSYSDTLLGSDRNDGVTEQFDGRAGNDFIDGRGGIDVAQYDWAASAVNVNLATGTASDGQGGVDTLANIEGIRGSIYNDVLTGGNAANGTSVLDYQNDLIEFFRGNAGNDTINGGQGYDRADYTSATVAVNVNLATGIAQDGLGGTDTLVNIEGVRGSGYNDTLIGSGAAFESFEGREGNDSIDGAGGVDRVDYYRSISGANINLATGIALDGYGGTDTLVNIEDVRGTQFNDLITGDSLNNRIDGMGGINFLSGAAGNDIYVVDFSSFDGSDTGIYSNIIDISGMADTLELSFNELADFSDGSFFIDVHRAGVEGSNLIVGIKQSALTPIGNPYLGKAQLEDQYLWDQSSLSYIAPIETASVNYLDQNGLIARVETFNLSLGAGSSQVVLNGSQTTDLLLAYGSGNTLNADDGNDILLASRLDAQDELDVYNTRNNLSNPYQVTLSNVSAFAQAGLLRGDTLSGGSGNDILRGYFGNDYLDGGVGADLMIGLEGNDTYIVDSIGDDVTENYTGGNFSDAGGIDTVQASIAYTLGSYLENLTLTGSSAIDGTGNSLDNLITGNASDNTLAGNAGNDTLIGGVGNDNLSGDAGNDSLYGGAGYDYLTGGAGNDTLDGGVIPTIFTGQYTFDNNTASYSSSIAGINVNLQTGTAQDGLGGTDTLSNINIIQGSNFADVITGSTRAVFEEIRGGRGDDTLDGGVISDTINHIDQNRVSYSSANGAVTVDLRAGTATGADGSDTLSNFNQIRGSSYSDTLLGSDRNDGVTEQFDGRAGNDFIDGRGGIDVAQYDWAASAVNVNLATGTASDGQGGVDTLANIEGIRGSIYNDVLTGGNAANGTSVLDYQNDLIEFFRGNAGNDTINGGQGYDRADYTSATVAVNVNLATGIAQDGLGGTDTLVNIEGVRGSGYNDTLIGSGAAFESFEGREGNDSIDGAGGVDRVDYYRSISGANINLATGIALDGYGGTDTLVNIEDVRGTQFNDLITGDSLNNRIDGSSGDDSIDGGAGNDTLDGGVGNDLLVGGLGNDSLIGGAGVDTASYSSSGAAVTVNLSTTTAQNTVNAGSDTLSSIENLMGSAFNDALTGSTLDNVINGGLGNDTMAGGLGNDTYIVSATTDVVTEAANAGTDTVQTDITYTLGVNLENLTLTGSTAINGTGNASANIIIGNDGANILTGAAGADTLNGGNGSDIYSVTVLADYAAGETINDSGTTVGDVDQLRVGLAAAGTFTVLSTTTGIENIVIGTGVAAAAVTTATTAINVDASALATAVSITGNAGANSLTGSSGNDTINGGAGNDSLIGGIGNDSLTGGLGIDTFRVATGTDTITDLGNGGAEILVVTGGTANATVTTAWTATVATSNTNGTANINTAALAVNLAAVTAGNTGFNVTNTGAATTLTGSALADTLTGGTGNDTLNGGAGNDSLTGGTGVDILTGAAGADTLNGGNGSDIYSVTVLADYAAGETINDSGTTVGDVDELRVGLAAAGTFTVLSTTTGIENIVIGTGVAAAAVTTATTAINVDASALATAVSITGNAGANSLTGSSGNDTINGGAGNDSLIGGIGNDSLTGGLGIDTFRVATGTDTITDLGNGGAEILVVTGGTANATVTTAWTATVATSNTNGTANINTAALAVNLAAVTAGNTGFNVTNTGAATTLTGSALADTLTGGTGNDTLNGGAGNDSLTGGTGVDILTGAAGADTLNGGNGSDIYSVTVLADYAAGETINDSGTTVGDVDELRVGLAAAGTFTVLSTTTGIENIVIGTGVAAAAVTTATTAINVDASALATAVSITGNAGANSLTGSSGNDTINGGAGNDSLIGGIGNDSLTGGLGIDTFRVATGTDTITDLGNGGAEILVVTGGTANATVTTAWTATVATSNTNGTANINTAALAVNLAAVTAGNTGFNVTNTGAATTLTGSALADTLTGGTGNDTLNGGAGNDSLTGGAGVDTFTVASGIDSIADLGFGGADVLTVVAGSTANVTLGAAWTAGATSINRGAVNITTNGFATNLAAVVTAATNGFNVTNIGLATTLTGSGLNDTLTGGTGVDAISGGAGNDSIIGGDGADIITGGAGTDNMNGGNGSDLYSVTVLADYAAGETINDSGIGVGDVDELRIGLTAAGTFTLLANTTGMEKIVIGTGIATAAVTSATTAINVSAAALTSGVSMTGNAGINILTGSSGSDTIAGGLGNDNLTGGLGSDRFIFNSTTGATNIDTITDLTTAVDSIWLDKAIFTALAANTSGQAITNAQFWSGAGVVTGHDADDRVVYNTTNGALYYDADGNGAGAAVQIAIIGAPATHPLSASDIFVL